MVWRKKAFLTMFLLISFVVVMPLQTNAKQDSHSKCWYYGQLDKKRKDLYRQIYEHYKDGVGDGSMTISWKKKWEHVNLEKKSAYVYQIVPSFYASFKLEMEKELLPVIKAVTYDHPELSWLLGNGYGYQPKLKYGSYQSGRNYTWVSMEQMVFQLKNKELESKSDMATAILDAKEQLEGKSYEFDQKNDSRYEQLKKIHDYLCDTLTYDRENTDNRFYQRTYSAFSGDRKTVCAGYARAFKVLCDAYDIPCVLISGTSISDGTVENHIWNGVKMEDGNWYAIDCAWDDQKQRIYYDYFLSGNKTVAIHFNKTTFEKTHRPRKKENGYVLKPVTLSEESYEREKNDFWEYFHLEWIRDWLEQFVA